MGHVVLVDLALVAALRELDYFDLGHDWSVVLTKDSIFEFRPDDASAGHLHKYADRLG